MSDYTREVEPDLTEFDLGLYRAALGTGPGKIVLDFLKDQPEVWWCEEHGSGFSDPDPGGFSFCQMAGWNPNLYLPESCRMARARIVVTP